VNLFCQVCNSYLGPRADYCNHCKDAPKHDPMLPPDPIFWSTTIPGSLVGPPLITPEQVICCWCGEYEGGIQGFDSETGQLLWSQSTEPPQSIILNQDRIFLATQGIVRHSGGVYGYELHGREKPTPLFEPKPEKANGCCDILLNGDRLFAVGRGGSLVSLSADGRGRQTAETQLTCGEEVKRLGKWGQNLVVICQCGTISLVPPGLSGQIQVIDTKRALTGSFAIYKDILYAGTKREEGGGLLRIDRRQKTVQMLPDGTNLVLVNATPFIHNRLLLVSAYSHRLHALDVESGREVWRHTGPDPECKKSLNSSPIVMHGLAFVGANDGRVYIVDIRNGHVSTTWNFPPGFTSVGSPAISGDKIYIAAHKNENGKKTSQMMVTHWSHGQYEMAAEQLETEKAWEEAANYYSLASIQQAGGANKLKKKAEYCWIEADKPELAGAFWDAHGNDERAAECLAIAGERANNRDQPETAAVYYYQAARIYWRLGKEAKHDEYRKMAARLAQWPVIRLSKLNVPKLTLKQAGEIAIKVENIGRGPARNMVIRVGWSLQQLAELHLNRHLYDNYQLVEGKGIIIKVKNIIPTQAHDNLIIYLEHQPPNLDIVFEEKMPLELEAGPEPHKIDLGDSVMADIGIMLNGDRPAIITVGDMAKSKLRIQENPTPG